MINGIRLSQVYDIKRQKLNHQKRLERIINSPSLKAIRSRSNKSIYSISRMESMHETRRNFNKQQRDLLLKKQNHKIVDALVKIQAKKSSSLQITKKFQLPAGHWHNYFNEKNLKTQIYNTNIGIASRISSKKSLFDYKKDIKQYSESRKNFQRIKKFQLYKNLSNKVNVQTILTQPAFKKNKKNKK